MRSFARRSFLACLVLASGCLDPDAPGNLVPRTVAEDDALPRFTLRDGARIHLRTQGDPKNPTLITLHGGPGGDMRGMLGLGALSERYFVVHWDQRGTGLSERVPSSDFTVETYAADLHELVQRFSPDAPVTLFGHSWGAMYAALYIQRHPDRVGEAVLSEPGFLNASIANETELFTFGLTAEGLNDLGWSEWAMSPDGDARADFLLSLGQGWSQPGYYEDPDDPDNSKAFRLGARAMRDLQGSAKTDGAWDFDFSSGLDRFCKPVTLIGTTINTVIGFEQQERRHAPLFCDVELVRVEGEDHGWVNKHPDRVMEVLRAHLGAYKGAR
ncbi:alpha/beta fold hydrolase [Sorangium sp. So ce394]|uniref:alpha/beta fold hydrolase n=1 Tax=Sorangium sp. So ce394 TaxID=3133310 RepID=UPI003F5B2533